MKKLLLAISLLTLSNAYTYDYTSITCGSQMNTWKEAYFYLKACGVKRLDRDGNGIPCEKICK